MLAVIEETNESIDIDSSGHLSQHHVQNTEKELLGATTTMMITDLEKATDLIITTSSHSEQLLTDDLMLTKEMRQNLD